jgi:predicted O-methyltransferase YrrM
MISSYNNSDLNYGDLLNTITYLLNPKTIVEFGILDGYSLKCFNENSNDTCNIYAYDIFDNFNGNHANKQVLLEKFKEHKKINIDFGDFYKKFKDIQDKSIDILHVDIANNGEIYEFVLNNYINKLSENGIVILEGGSNERDNIAWMIKYNKPKIQPILQKFNSKYNIRTFGTIPSITIIKNY